MENQISFAEFIKNEILEFNWEDEQLGILFYSFLKTNGSINGNKFTVSSSLKTKNEIFINLFKKYYDVDVQVKEMESKIKYIINDEEFIDKLYAQESSLTLETDEKAMAFVAGAFIAKGWVSRPSSRFYHMEFRVGTIEHSLNLQEAIDSLGIQTKSMKKGNWFITYIKKSMSLSDLLRAMQAHNSMMLFEEERINRDFASSYSKMESIEAYNYEKIEAVSSLQIAAIEKLKTTASWKVLSKDKLRLAEIRLEHPRYSLSDLQYVFNEKHGKNVSKSTINNWLKALVEKANML